ncbi:MAG: Uma2 family endonuclease [Pseudanabaena sp.]|jgi:Uma2 family endonuclease|nr:Uma2 family endonuclease [Pseudanabaena sp. M051S1SP2A07QC]MCE2975297.1 Uma2 family endonuclease [Pseudanabaena sp. CoA8_M7]
MTIQTLTKHYTTAEYLELEEQSASKNEYHNGEIIPMTGGTTNHNTITLNTALLLKLALKGQPYKVFMNDVRLWIDRDRFYTYPDLMVISDQPIYQSQNQTIVTNPTLIVEVLSKSTRNYDLGEKFGYYRTIPTLREYLLIEQSHPQILHYAKVDTKWLLTEYENISDLISLQSLPCELAIAQIYEDIEF